MSSSDPEDYMSDIFLAETPKPKKATLTYSERRRLKLSSNRGSIKPLREREKESREQGLSQRIDTEENASPGLMLLRRMGYKEGMALGRSAGGRIDPVPVEIRQGRSGLGLGTEIRERESEEVERAVKKARIEDEEYRSRIREGRLEKRAFAQLESAKRICEDLDVKIGVEKNPLWWTPETDPADDQSTLAESDEDGNEKGRESDKHDDVADGNLSPEDTRIQLGVILDYLREKHHYCFYCGSVYKDADELERECPGETEEDHD
ncbi:10807_t:CDS:2 [Paraglomus brasilianum]|uniref:10807_t:CDS:1 n=1 Tax=Paraglomus brasilianum TaxID=144538 RepID=A0A9N8VG16_9GLOM|nr:10807_t:CDS:2 [Paraglomus brasilianum]